MNNLYVGSWSFSIGLFMWWKAIIGNKAKSKATIHMVWREIENISTFKIYTAVKMVNKMVKIHSLVFSALFQKRRNALAAITLITVWANGFLWETESRLRTYVPIGSLLWALASGRLWLSWTWLELFLVRKSSRFYHSRLSVLRNCTAHSPWNSRPGSGGSLPWRPFRNL